MKVGFEVYKTEFCDMFAIMLLNKNISPENFRRNFQKVFLQKAYMILFKTIV